MRKALDSILLIVALISVQAETQQQAIAGVATKKVGCGFIHATDSSKSLRDRCTLTYGTAGVYGPGFAQLKWSDGVQTNVVFHVNDRGITVDGEPAQKSLPERCGYTAVVVNGNTLFWGNPYAKPCD